MIVGFLREAREDKCESLDKLGDRVYSWQLCRI